MYEESISTRIKVMLPLLERKQGLLSLGDMSLQVTPTEDDGPKGEEAMPNVLMYTDVPDMTTLSIPSLI